MFSPHAGVKISHGPRYGAPTNGGHMNQQIFSEDCEEIFKALERLAKGTCGVPEGDKNCTWNLMPRIQMALTEHITLEERDIFPFLSSDERSRHKLEHERLLRLLASASFEFECGYGEQLSIIVKQLLKALRNHHEEIVRNVA